ncbi:peptidoglycan-binding protein [Maritimibacter dapengensis]|uniref:Peptidoglycan-binding protein n=1 Tax=Maritimibacter dapengensis TaxID=2836868 RepID=A0ABS6SWH9_9RHOB|nr:peptidoglycan-binding protein [Maritimibacter dapengensis]MBV7377323.1 peptidoglycan-binding protein [Maritimibacter dapengensis]
MTRNTLATLATSFAALMIGAQTASADAALILVQSDYAELDDVSGANQASELAQIAEDAGFEVTASLDSDVRDAADAIDDFRRDAEDGERVMILISGHILSDGSNTWLLTNEAEDVSRFNIGSMAVPLGPVMEIASDFPGQAVLMMAGSGEDADTDDLLPVETIDAAQGVSVFSGRIDRLTDMTEDMLLVPGLSLAEIAEEAPRGVEASGFISPATAFLPAGDGSFTVIERTVQDPQDAFWVVARTMDTAEGYDLYLEYYPDGLHNGEARAALRQLESDAQNADEMAEAALELNRAARRQVQRNLSLLGHNPRGIDGIFGPATRSAISGWQGANGYDQTGYLDAPQLRQMTEAADARAAQLEAEAEERQREQDRQDRAYWNQIGQGQDEAGLRAYLERYPDGLFADVAEARLEQIESEKIANARAEERLFWSRAREEDRATSYRAYLDRYPDGLFVDNARARLQALRDDRNRDQLIAQARDEEREVAGNPVSRLLVETRLRTLGYELSGVDGEFDGTTRRAIRRFQRSRGLDVTGFVTQDTMVRLLG